MNTKKKFSAFEAVTFGLRDALDHFQLFFWVIFAGLCVFGAVVGIVGIFNIQLLRDLNQYWPQLQELQTCVGPACIVVAQPLFWLMREHAMTLIIGTLVLSIVGTSLDAGFKKIALDVYDTENGTFKTLFSYFYLAPKLVVGWLVYLVIVSVGFCLLVIPGVVWMLRFVFFPYFIIDKNMELGESMKASYQITKGHVWELFALWLLMKFFAYLSAMVVVGFFITWPLSVLTYVYVYRKLTL